MLQLPNIRMYVCIPLCGRVKGIKLQPLKGGMYLGKVMHLMCV